MNVRTKQFPKLRRESKDNYLRIFKLRRMLFRGCHSRSFSVRVPGSWHFRSNFVPIEDRNIFAIPVTRLSVSFCLRTCLMQTFPVKGRYIKNFKFDSLLFLSSIPLLRYRFINNTLENLKLEFIIILSLLHKNVYVNVFERNYSHNKCGWVEKNGKFIYWQLFSKFISYYDTVRFHLGKNTFDLLIFPFSIFNRFIFQKIYERRSG